MPRIIPKLSRPDGGPPEEPLDDGVQKNSQGLHPYRTDPQPMTRPPGPPMSELFIAPEAFYCGNRIFFAGQLVRRDDPLIAEIARKHPHRLLPADRHLEKVGGTWQPRT